MSDFLSHLIAKSAGNASAIRPYLPSRFERVAPPAPPLDVIDEISLAAVIERPSPMRMMPSASQQHHEHVAPSALAEERPANAAMGEVRTSMDDPGPTAPAPPPPMREPKPARRDSDPVVRERLMERTLFVDRETERPGEKPAEPLHSPIERGLSASTQLITEPQPTLVWRDEATTYIISETFEPPLAPVAIAREPVNELFPATPTEARRTGAISPQALASQRNSEPDIYVTIGRVEVRATPPPTPPERRRSTPQHMTLDEYLRRRTSGEQQ
jgi:hypothetical protein